MKQNKRKFNIELGCLMLNQQQVINKNSTTILWTFQHLCFLNVFLSDIYYHDFVSIQILNEKVFLIKF